jgi:hypothetical protein
MSEQHPKSALDVATRNSKEARY